MLLLVIVVIVAFIATTAFYAKAKRLGLHPGRAGMLPFIALGLFLIFSFVANVAISQMLTYAQPSETIERSIWLMFNAFILLSYLMFIRKNWHALLARSSVLPDADDSTR